MNNQLTRRNFVNVAAKDDISGDELGLSTARNTGLRVADFALKLRI